ncbi:hypothetical protein C0V75_17770 [Tabrizicola sp. TH137]|uniref:hypothetical protein n=1 Tax=Tabrizicola sp. TH137 TaxID=2067452 RepID=UPI000C7BD4BE|nr:hypothetical protein [Tabrizicola sp. TH137]PLL11133.1 hypothetical protein C0V75_17770 [Tabrizicola sp. TH137]
MTLVQAPRRFVILSGSRSGTSLLSETLNVHPEILCHGELFHPTPASHIKRQEGDLSVEEAVALRDRDPIGYLDWALTRPGVAAAGFKMWRSQQDAVCDRLLADEATLKIIYERENVLARFSSSRLVKATGIYNINSERARPGKLNTLVDFNRKAFLGYFDAHRALFAGYRARARGPVLDLTYRDVIETGFSRVLAFLGVAEQALPPQKQRLHSNEILSRFAEADRDAIRKTLAEIGHPEWVSE